MTASHGGADHAVELVPVQDQEAPPSRVTWTCRWRISIWPKFIPRYDRNISSWLPGMYITFVPCALPEQFLQNIVVRLFPIPRTPHPPKINNVPNQIKVLGLGVFQEIEQVFSLAPPGPKVNIRDPDGTIPNDIPLSIHTVLPLPFSYRYQRCRTLTLVPRSCRFC